MIKVLIEQSEEDVIRHTETLVIDREQQEIASVMRYVDNGEDPWPADFKNEHAGNTALVVEDALRALRQRDAVLRKAIG